MYRRKKAECGERGYDSVRRGWHEVFLEKDGFSGSKRKWGITREGEKISLPSGKRPGWRKVESKWSDEQTAEERLLKKTVEEFKNRWFVFKVSQFAVTVNNITACNAHASVYIAFTHRKSYQTTHLQTPHCSYVSWPWLDHETHMSSSFSRRYISDQ